MTTNSGSKAATKSRAWAIPASTSSSRSRGGPGRFSSGLWDIQQRASGTVQFTPSRSQGQGFDQGGTQLGGALGDARAGDTPVRAQEHHRFLVPVEPGLDVAAAVTDDHHVRIVLPGPAQLSEG